MISVGYLFGVLALKRLSFRLLLWVTPTFVIFSHRKNGTDSSIGTVRKDKHIMEWLNLAFLSYFLPIDLSFWYGIGPGNPTSAAQGIGYVQELIARLTQTPITQFNTTTNSTITNSNVTFPLNQPIYVDATHDVIISNSAFYSVMTVSVQI